MTPAQRGSRSGNRVTAERWARLIRALGHRVSVRQTYVSGKSDLLIAVHARKSNPSVRRFRTSHPQTPIVVALAGTDLYGDLGGDVASLDSLAAATRLVILQPRGFDALPPSFRPKTRVILQSTTPVKRIARPRNDVFEVCVLGHLRSVKDPFRTALAARLLPVSSRIRVMHIGAALSAEMAERARSEQVVNARYRWLGERPRSAGIRLLARSRLCVLSSRSEGGANVLTEAIVHGVPVIASHIPGSVGVLGESYPGYFPVGNTGALAAQLYRAETDAQFYEQLKCQSAEVAPSFDPALEREAWRTLLAELRDHS